MSIQPLISFKAGKCDAEFDSSPPKIKPLPDLGWLYVYVEDELIHLCWRDRLATLRDPELDLVIVPSDATFEPYTRSADSADHDYVTSPKGIKGRIFKLAFLSSSARHFFWLQSSPPFKDDPSRFSERDTRIGIIVNALLQGEEVDTKAEVANLRQTGQGGDGDATMEDAGEENVGSAVGNATGGNSQAGQGNSSAGERSAPQDSDVQSHTTTAVQNFLKSLQPGAGGGGGGGGSSAYQEEPTTTLPDLLPTENTTSTLLSLPEEQLDVLLIKHLPHSLIYLAIDTDPSEIPEASNSQADDEETAAVLVEGLSLGQKKSIIERVARSPQFYQALASLTGAIRDGGLPGIADALKLDVPGKGYINQASGVSMSGAQAMNAFVEGVKKSADESGQ